MADHESIEGLIPWYVNGTLSGEDRRQVEDHLADCEACRAIVEDARALETLGRADPAQLLDHVQAQHLESFALDPESVPTEVAGWICGHLAECGICGDAHRILERSAVVSSPVDDVETRAATGTASIWSLLRRSVLHPVAAAAYLLLLAVLVPVYRGLVHLPDVERRIGALEKQLIEARRWGGRSICRCCPAPSGARTGLRP